MSDVEAFAEDAESASKIYLEAAQGRPTPNDELQSVLAGNVEALGAINAKLVHEKHQKENAGGAAHCATCERDHDQLCPEGWSELAGGRCSGPSTYDGPCMAFADFSGLSANAKMEPLQRRYMKGIPRKLGPSVLGNAARSSMRR